MTFYLNDTKMPSNSNNYLGIWMRIKSRKDYIFGFLSVQITLFDEPNISIGPFLARYWKQQSILVFPVWSGFSATKMHCCWLFCCFIIQMNDNDSGGTGNVRETMLNIY